MGRASFDRRTLLSASFAIGSFGLSGARPATTAIVETASGRVQGVLSNGSLAFKGVRYGASTGGENRFSPPKAPVPWTGVMQADTFGASAPQTNPAPPSQPPKIVLPKLMTMAGVARPPPLPESEDCLFLNVWTATTAKDAKRPVMVWLHGGFFSSGSGSTVDGSVLASRHGVVVVSVNHRLNVFGYTDFSTFGLEGAEHAGNAGMLDIIAALKWVRANIERFGGDPGRVTVFGESGGGMKTCFLLASPAAVGLYHRAVIQSGPALRFMERQTAADITARLLAKLRLEKSIEDVRRVSSERLLQAFFAIQAEHPATSFTALPCFAPVLDQALLPAHPFSPAATTASRNIPMLIGWNKGEMSFFMGDDDAGFHLDAEGLDKRLKLLIGEDWPQVLAIYRHLLPTATPTQLYIRIWSDLSIAEPTTRLAERKAGQASADVFVYRFDWPSPALGGALQSVHTLEQPFAFDTTDKASLLVGDAPEAGRLGSHVAEAWARFAADGAPGELGGTTWPAYDERKPTLLINVQSGLADNPDLEAIEALRRTVHDQI